MEVAAATLARSALAAGADGSLLSALLPRGRLCAAYDPAVQVAPVRPLGIPRRDVRVDRLRREHGTAVSAVWSPVAGAGAPCGDRPRSVGGVLRSGAVQPDAGVPSAPAVQGPVRLHGPRAGDDRASRQSVHRDG